MTEIKSVDAPTLKQWVDNNEAIIIDVRELDEYKNAHIANSTLIPLGECTPQIVPHNPDKKIVFLCRRGFRSYNACNICLPLSPHNELWNFEGGIEAWITAGYDVKQITE